MLDYISKNKPIARLLKCKINTEFKADGLAQSDIYANTAGKAALNGL